MSYFEALTKDRLGEKQLKVQLARDDLKFTENLKIKRQKKEESESLAIANATEAAQVNRRRAIENKKKVDTDVDDDTQIDKTGFGVQVIHALDMRQKKTWTNRPPQWETITNYMMANTCEDTCQTYADDLKYLGKSMQPTLYRWKREISKQKVLNITLDMVQKTVLSQNIF